jgi:hypothetical protein
VRSLYDAITNPIDEDTAILEIVDTYANKKIDSGKDIINNEYDMYSRIIDGGRRNELNIDKYDNEFYNNIVKPNLNKLFISMKNRGEDYYDLYDKTFKENLKKGYEKEDVLEALPFYPIKSFQEIFKKCDTYDDFLKYIKNNNYYNRDIVEYCSCLFESDKKKLREKLEQKYDKNFINQAVLCFRLNRKLYNKFLAINNHSMGFHVNPNRLEPIEGQRLFEDNIKLYLNAEEDTYKLARLFQEECEKRGLVYYYKVARCNDEFEFARKDKMCIYSSYENVVRYIRIISKIKKEHPEIKFDKPPISTGLVAGYIGIGQDVKGKTNNRLVTAVYFDVVNNIFKDMPREKIMGYMKSHPEYIEIIRKEIKRKLKESGMSDKQGIYESEKEAVKKLDISPKKRSKESNEQKKQNEISQMLQMPSEWDNLIEDYKKQLR